MAASWLDCTDALPPPSGITVGCGLRVGHVGAALLYLDVLSRHRPQAPHLRFAALTGDAPAAAVLLGHRRVRLDRAGTAYAVAGTQEHLGVLMNAGYQPADAFRLPAGQPLWPTWRPPVTATADTANTTGWAA